VKEISVEEAQSRLGELLADACRGEVVVVTDGHSQVTLMPHLPLEDDSAIDGPFEPYSSDEMIKIGERIIRAKRQ